MNNIEIEARQKAEETRRMLGYDIGPILDMFTLLESQGILLVKSPINRDGLSAIFLRNNSGFIIFINSSKTLGHQYFSAAHELYHYEYNKEMTGQICNTALFSKNKSENERKADYFAVHFLMPETTIRRYVKDLARDGRLSISDIIKLQHYFKVSYAAMVIRLKELDLIELDQYNKFMEERIVARSKSLGYNPQLSLPTNDKYISPEYIQLGMNLYEKGDITYRKLVEYLSIVDIAASDLMNSQYGEVEEIAEETSFDY